jgi:FKBP-type peptidyl-prolyl cis-trans isomerase
MSSSKIAGFITLVVVVLGVGMWYTKKLDMESASALSTQQQQIVDTQKQLMNQLQIKDVVVGTGAEAKTGDTVSVNYLGTFTDGTKFDSSYDRHQPFEFHLGAGEVIQGWDLGVVGMKVGGKRELTIPPELGYGNRATGSIPPNSILHFTVELLGVTPAQQ